METDARCFACDRPVHPEAVECPACGQELSMRAAFLGLLPWMAGAVVLSAALYLAL